MSFPSLFCNTLLGVDHLKPLKSSLWLLTFMETKVKSSPCLTLGLLNEEPLLVEEIREVWHGSQASFILSDFCFHFQYWSPGSWLPGLASLIRRRPLELEPLQGVLLKLVSLECLRPCPEIGADSHVNDKLAHVTLYSSHSVKHNFPQESILLSLSRK